MSSLVEHGFARDSERAVSVVRDLSYLSGGVPVPSKGRLDLYLPRGSTRFPVIVSIHGGALVEGDKSNQEFVGRRFAAARHQMDTRQSARERQVVYAIPSQRRRQPHLQCRQCLRHPGVAGLW